MRVNNITKGHTVLVSLLISLSCLITSCSSAENVTINANANANRATATPTATPTPANSNATNWNMSHEEYNKNANSYRAEAKNKGDTIGEDIEDGWIHFKVRAALAAVDDLRDSAINVDVDKNVVTLHGIVANPAQKSKAEQIIKSVEGIKSVVNKLEECCEPRKKIGECTWRCCDGSTKTPCK